jgi:hypothetical protein
MFNPCNRWPKWGETPKNRLFPTVSRPLLLVPVRIHDNKGKNAESERGQRNQYRGVLPGVFYRFEQYLKFH